MNAPRSFAEAMRQWPQIQRDIELVRQLANLRFITAAGDTALMASPGSNNAAVDLRLITSGGQPANPSTSQVTTTAAPVVTYFTAVERQFLQSIPNNTFTPVSFDNGASNTFGMWTISDPTKLTIPISGVYLVTGWVDYTANATGTRQTRLRANPSGTVFGLDIRPAVSSSDFAGASICGIHTFAAGEYVDVLTLQNSGGALTLHDARIEIVRLGPVVSLATSGLNSETDTWKTAVAVNGGTMASDSITIADTLISQLKFTSFYSKIKYLVPFLGSNLAAALVPLIDPLSKGNMTNANFVDADFSQATGLQGNGSTKILTMPINCSQLGTSNSGGMGYWENNINFTGTGSEVMGNYGNSGNSRFVVDLRSTAKFFVWGGAANSVTQATASVNGHYYGQRSGATSRAIYFAGAQIGTTNTTSDAATGAGDRNIRLMGSDEAPSPIVYWKGRCAVAYLTDGTLTAIEISQLHTILQTYLITPTGR